MFRRLLLAFGIALAFLSTAVAQDAADVVVRLNRVENVTRQLSGQIEQLQYENRQLKEQLRKFQEDVEFRFQEGKGGGGRAPAAARPPAAAPSVDGANPGAAKPGKRGDAFNPDQNPNAPGAPRQLGATPPSAPLPSPPPAARIETPAPDLRVARALPPDGDVEAGLDDAQDESDLPPPGLGGAGDLAPLSPARTANAAVEPPPAGSVAATGSGDARADFDAAYALVQGRQYDQAEMSLRQFLQSHPRDRNVPKATYWLGETYLQRNRSREAAEQFLKVSTDYAASPVAPEAMMKLGASLSAMGAKAQACATLAEVERKYPSASAGLRQGIEREQKRARCTG